MRERNIRETNALRCLQAAGAAFFGPRCGLAAAAQVEHLAWRSMAFASGGLIAAKQPGSGVTAAAGRLVDGAEAATGVALGALLGAVEGSRLVWRALRSS